MQHYDYEVYVIKTDLAKWLNDMRQEEIWVVFRRLKRGLE